MKKNLLELLGHRMTFKILLLSVVAIVAASCQKEDLKFGEPANSESSFIEDEDLKRGRRAPAPGDASIAAIAIDAGFSELVGALVYVDEELDAGLVDLFLEGTDQYTVFAPTDEAFDNLYGALEIDGITDLPAELVLDVLLYHVTEGRRAANSVVPPVRPRTITTLLGATFTMDRNARITAIGNTANIVAPDISASNGIIHVIDAVILPIE